MKILTLDAETFYSTEYSLRKMSTPEYILSDLFECTGLAVKEGDSKSYWVEGDDVERFFAQADKNVMSVSHNSLFDNALFAWRYGWVPRAMVDTMGVARALLQPFLKSLSLDSVAGYLGLGQKTKALANVKNMRLHEIRAHPDLYAKFIDYGLNDADLCYGIFQKLVMSGMFPPIEMAVMDAVLRCAVVPQFVTNVPLLYESLQDIKNKKAATLQEAMGHVLDDHEICMPNVEDVFKSKLMSNDKFAELLESNGVTPPTKISGITGKEAYAFAKTDQDFLDLLEHPDVAIQTLVAARLGHKSTIEETRHERFIKIAELPWPKTPVTNGGNLALMPMPLRFSGAHTHRLSGDWKMNVQNMGRGSKLRESLEAPPGHTVVAGDESQVEARFVATLCGQEDLRAAFERGEDVYCDFASSLYNKPITKKEKTERWMGKTCILGLGFGLGDNSFEKQVPPKSQDQLGVKMVLPPGEAKRIVNTYRTRYPHIATTWKLLNVMGIRALTTGVEWRWGPVIFRKEEIELPNGMKLYYHNLRQVAGGKFGTEWVFDYGHKTKRLYGGKILENCLSASTEVLTLVGWKHIVDVLPDDKIWDGEEWVSHAGVTFRGNNVTAPLNGVRMTADHKVLTNDGWVRAAQAKGLHWDEVRIPDGYPGRGYDRPEASMGDKVHVWRDEDLPQFGTIETTIMRVHEEGLDREEKYQARNVETPHVLGMAGNDRPMPTTNPPRMGPVRREGDSSVLPVDGIREFHGGHGADLPDRVYDRTKEQFEGLQPGQLPVGQPDSSSEEYPLQPDYRHPRREDVALRSSRIFGDWGDDAGIQIGGTLENERPVPTSRSVEPTYDILNCGPRHRFVVRGDSEPFIVHNCVQALARIITMEAAVRVQKRLERLGIRLALQVHDELVFVVRDEHVEVTKLVLAHELRQRPDWLPNLPLDCEVGSGPNYGSAK